MGSAQPAAPAPGDRVLVAMSGGVDSSVAAALLHNQGYEVLGVHLQLWDQGSDNFERSGARCCSMIDSNDARRVCDKLGIPYYVIDAQDVFRAEVVDYFVHEYIQTRTPNPCVQCNSKIKFDYLFEKAAELKCKWVATGHYASVERDLTSEQFKLMKASDPQKDQSYFLFGLKQKALRQTLFPLGGFSKNVIRKLAEDYSLNVADKPDSQEICFVGQEGYQGFIEQRVAPSLRPSGVIRSAEGMICGEHNGLFRYTIGQRKGLKLSGVIDSPENYYVVGFDHRNNVLVVGREEQLLNTELVATNTNWVRPIDEMRTIDCSARVRSRSEEAPCEVIAYENNTVRVRFKNPQRAITPGQAIVFYSGEEVLGGGFIERAGPVL